MRSKLYISLSLVIVATAIWSSDSVTLQGERTIYTVECSQGVWQANACTGKMLAASRYRYRALRAHNEVFFWVAGSTSEPAGRLINCAIEDGRNWICPVANADASRSITLALKRGNPVSQAAWPTRPLHAVSKVTWYLLKLGISTRRADDPTF